MCLWAVDTVCGLAGAADAAQFEGAGGLEGVEFEVDVVSCSGGEGGRVDEWGDDVQWFRYEVRDNETLVEAGSRSVRGVWLVAKLTLLQRRQT